MHTKAALVLTTINDASCLDGYYKNFESHGHLKDVKVFVIPDLKTPRSCFERCQALKSKGLDISIPGFTSSSDFMLKLNLNLAAYPYNSDARRNIGYLMALASDVDFVISIDDDNYCMEGQDFLLEHSKFGPSDKIVRTECGWFNICEYLTTPVPVYQRGFPYFARHKDSVLEFIPISATVHANQGLWLGDPDLDALTWLTLPTKVFSASLPRNREPLALSQKVWAPLNSQNTAVVAEAMPAYFFIPMGADIRSNTIDRFGDIFQGYFLQACMKHLNASLRFGLPVVQHRRNQHNYWKDAEKEWIGIRLLEEILPWLVELKLSGSDYIETYDCLAVKLDEFSKFNPPALVKEASNYLQNVSYLMRKWSQACRTIGVKMNVGQNVAASGRMK